MLSTLLSSTQRNNIIISTGNILGNQKTVARTSREELFDGIKACLENDEAEINQFNEIQRIKDDLQQKITENERSNISIGAKIFLNNKNTETLQNAIERLLKILEVNNVDNTVLAYHHPCPNSGGTQPINNGNINFNELKSLWSTLEKFVDAKKICRIGISDLDTQTLTELYKNSKIHPSIVQISQASCCVVPESLTEFCNENDIQLLTHNDNEIKLNEEAFPVPGYKFDWVVRYQIHVKCRGVLAAKGYIVAGSKAS